MKKQYICDECNYLLTEISDAHGAPMVFEELPDDWKCPGCGADKTKFTEKELPEK